MSISGSIPVTDSRPTIAADLGRCALRVGWQCIRLPLFLFLLVLEPVVTLALGAFALLGVLTAGGLVRIAGGKELRGEPLEILRIPVLLIPNMNSDEDLLEC
jgi:hypothetical protein